MIEQISFHLRQFYPIIGILIVSNIGAFSYMKIKNTSSKIEIMNVKSEFRKIRKIEEYERNNKIL